MTHYGIHSTHSLAMVCEVDGVLFITNLALPSLPAMYDNHQESTEILPSGNSPNSPNKPKFLFYI